MAIAEYVLGGSRFNGADLRQSLNEAQSRLFLVMNENDANVIKNFTSSYELSCESSAERPVNSAYIAAPTINSAEMTTNACDIEEPKEASVDTNVVTTKLSSSLARRNLIISSQRARQNITFIKRVINATTKTSDTAQNMRSRSVNTTKLIIDTCRDNYNNTKKLGGKSSPEHIEKLIGKEITTPRKVAMPLLLAPSSKKSIATTTTTPMHKVIYTTPSKSLNTTAITPIVSKGMSRTPRPSNDLQDKFVKPTGLPNKLSLDMPPPIVKPSKNITKLSFDTATKKPQQVVENVARQLAPMESSKLFGLINSKSTMAMTPIKASADTTAHDEIRSPKRVAENPFMSLVTNHNNH